MKKLAAILFLIVYLFSTNEVYQLMKFPVLFAHYEEHKILRPDISFLTFLSLHYVYDSSQDPDYERDMQLPFKMIDQFTVPVVPACIPDSVLPRINSRQIISSGTFVSNESFILTDFLSGIWQPPRFC